MPARRSRAVSKAGYHHGDLRQALIDASLALISEEGFHALSLREVARRAGVTHAAPYRHFADKEALLAAVAEEGFRMMTRAMEERLARAASSEERLRATGVAYVLFAVEHPAHFRVMFGPHFQKPTLHAGMATEGTNAFGLLVQTLGEGQEAGVIRPGELLPLALTAWSLVHGLASLFVDGQLEGLGLGSARLEALAETQTRLLFEGLAAPTPPRRR